jgi:transcriptional regulator with XRE-family HTH domain
MEATEAFGARLRRIRGEKKVSVRELARRSGVNVSTVSETERGKIWQHGYPPVEQVRAYATALDVPLSVLAPDIDDDPPPRPARPDVPDAFLSDREVEDYCLKHHDPNLREQARRGKEAMTPAAFTRNCRRTYRAHYHNSMNIWGAALDDREPGDEDTFGPSPLGAENNGAR